MTKIFGFTFLFLFFSCTNIIHKEEKPKSIESKEEKINNPKIDKKISTSLQESKAQTNTTEPIEQILPVNTKIYENSNMVKNFCVQIDSYFQKYNWGKSKCDDYSWHHVRNSVKMNPLIWYVYGNENSKGQSNTTLIFCGVHGDEITPVKFCFDLLEDIKNNPQIIGDNLIIIAPLANPDSFLKRKPTRTNARGVDINRNFPTKDWNTHALKLWKTKYHSDKRRYPGPKALSEPETLFQVNLIKRYNPKKVISVHAPLTMLDYDGPNFAHEGGKSAKELLQEMSTLANSYKISNYPFFPGSLGNYSGNERKIPTFTLELPNTDWNKTKEYYDLFRDAIHLAINKNFAN